MAASASDYFIKVAPNFSTTIGSAGVASDTTDVIPLNGVSGLPTDTAIELVINRVDSTGAETNNFETVRGVISGSNLTDAVRGVEGTAQAWDAGIVVEYLHTADIQNRMVDGFLTAFNQDGTIKDNSVLTDPILPSFYQDAGKTKKMTTPNTASDTLAAIAATQTLTNKRITKRIVSAASYTTDTGTSLNCDTTDMFIVTAQTGALKFNNPSGTPTDGQTLILAVSSSTTAARALTYDTQFESSTVTLPATTTATTARITIGLIWRADTSKWTCVAVA